MEIQVTELDVSQKSNSAADQRKLAQRYQDCFNLYKEMKDSGVNLSAVVIWGITDSTSWIGGYPLLFDKDYQAKDAFYAVADTNLEVAQIQTMNAYQDGTEADLERALEIQTPQTLQCLSENNIYPADMTFKAAWNEDGMVVRVYNVNEFVDSIAVYGSTEEQEGELLVTVENDSEKNYVDISVPLTGKVGNTVYLDLVA